MKETLVDPGYIPRAVVLRRSQNYDVLRRRGLHYIEQLAHAEWTDYNVHDPGITILELVCYAITDVALRTAYPMKDLLARQTPVWRAGASYAVDDVVAHEQDTYRCLSNHTSAVGKEPPNQPALWTPHRDFHLAHEILVSRPVSFDDLRRRLIDLPGVRNAWIERSHKVTYFVDVGHKTLTSASMPDTIELNGLFNVYLEYEDGVGDVAPSYRSTDTIGLRDDTGTGDYKNPAYKGLEFTAAEDARLDSVTVYPEKPGTVVVRLMDGGRVIAKTSQAVTATKTAVSIPLNFTLDAGRLYRLDATGTTINLHRTENVTFPMPASPGPVSITRGYAHGSNPSAGSRSYYFFYNWKVSHDSAGQTKGEVRAKAIERIHESRNLCEDVLNVCDLIPEEVAVCADIELRPDADTDTVEAEILYRIFQFISPAVRFYSLDEMQARGKAIDEIFDGPLLDHGFIDGDELAAIKRRCELHASDIIQIIMGVDGVTAVKSLKLLKRSDPDHPQEWILPLSSDEFRIAEFAAFPDPDDPPQDRFGSKITFYKRGLPYYANRKDVEPLYRQKKAADIDRKLTLRQQPLVVPAGTWRDVATYEPLQNELPAVYRVGRTRVPDREPAAQALSRQLTAYLTFFDQLLANCLAQLGQTSDLFTWHPTGARTYFTQALTGIAGLEPSGALDASSALGYPSFATAVAEMAETPARAALRRLTLLEHLAARYAEQFTEYLALMRPLAQAEFDRLPQWVAGTAYTKGTHVQYDGAEWECVSTPLLPSAMAPPTRAPRSWRQTSRFIGHLRRFLDDYPALSANRGGAFDWRSPQVAANVAGYQRRVYRLLDIDPVVRRDLAGHRFVILDTGTATEPAWCFELEDDNGMAIFRSVECRTKSSIEALLDLALRLGTDEANWVNAAGTVRRLVQHCTKTDGSGKTEDDRIGDIVGPGTFADVIAYFRLVANAEGFHLIEHILLRRRTVGSAATGPDTFLPIQVQAEDACCPPVIDPYSFRVSIVLPSWSPRFRNMKFRQLVEDTLRREAPAHVYPRICWVNHEQMKNLEIAMEEWQEELAWLAHDAASCSDNDGTRTGRMPLPQRQPAATAADKDAAAADACYETALKNMVEALYGLTNVYPLAQLHDCEETDGDVPQVTLGNTSLGTL